MVTELSIGLLGAGTVGAAVARRLEAHADLLAARSGGPLVLRRLAERDPGRARAVTRPGLTVSDDAAAVVAAADVDIVVELLGGLKPAATLLEAAIDRGLGVVTANKAVMATSGRRLAAAVRPASGGLACEAAVGGAIPVLAMLRDSLQGDTVRRITTVINGTTNHILGRLEAGATFEGAVADAQERGFAEADPSNDLDGHDAAQKICILAWFGMGADVRPEQVIRRGIRGITDADVADARWLDSAIRLVARAERTAAGLSLSVQPTLVPRPGHPFGDLEGAENAVVVETDLAGRLLLAGRGAGADAAASAVLSDIVAVARARREGRNVSLPEAAPTTVLDGEADTTAAWLRLPESDTYEAATAATETLARWGVQVERLAPGAVVDEMLALTKPASRAALVRAVQELDGANPLHRAIRAMDRLEASA